MGRKRARDHRHSTVDVDQTDQMSQTYMHVCDPGWVV